MRGLKKSKTVTWAFNLCQMRLFSSEESPSKVGMGTQNHLQAKASWPVQSRDEPDLPPGFEGIRPANLFRGKLSQIPLTKWRCPPQINNQWQVVAGEESKEMEAQNQREMRVLEAIYPRPSAIPPNPSASEDTEDSIANNQNIHVVPITPIEDDYTGQQDESSGARRMSNTSNCDQRNQVDRDLLMRILSSPKMVEQLITSQSASSCAPKMLSTTTQYNIPSLNLRSKNMFDPITKIAINRTNPLSAQLTTPECNVPCTAAAGGPFHPPQLRTGSIADVSLATSSSSFGAPATKDINYYRSLIQQHGQERRDVLPQSAYQSNQAMRTSEEPALNFMKSRESRSKIMKPCIYFNRAKGCRNGANCAYQHDMMGKRRFNCGISEAQSVKRVKLDRDIAGA